MTQRQAERLVARLQKLLRLQDWDTKVVLVDDDALNIDGDIGQCWRHGTLGHSKIIISTERDDYDAKTIVAHEVMHMLLFPLDQILDAVEELTPELRTLYNQAQELVIEKLERALLAAIGEVEE